MRYKTPRNLEKAAKLIMEKGYDEDTAVSVAPKFFEMVKPGTPSVEHFISLLVQNSSKQGRKHHGENL